MEQMNRYKIVNYWSLKDILQGEEFIIRVNLDKIQNTAITPLDFSVSWQTPKADGLKNSFIDATNFDINRKTWGFLAGSYRFSVTGRGTVGVEFTLEGYLELYFKYNDENSYYTKDYFIKDYSSIFLDFFNSPVFHIDETYNENDGYKYKFKNYIDSLMALIISRFKNHYVFSTDTENKESDEYRVKLYDFKSKIINILVMTYDKYSSLLGIYNSNLDKLMNPIKATTKGKIRFNDTPQDTGDFSDDAHTSNITANEVDNEVDGASKIERMDEIKRKMSMIMKEWSDEFEPLFIEEGNI